MKKSKWVLILILVLMAIISFLSRRDLISLTGGTVIDLPGNEIITSVLDEGDMQVYFCPQDDCENVLLAFLDSAEESIHCALFDIGLESVQDKLLEKERQAIEVKIVTDNDYLEKFDHPFVKADKWGLMHDKFCIIDNQKISTGSMNPTNNGAHKNNNNLLLINSKVLAQNYKDEFVEMWNGKFKGGEKVANPKVELEGIRIQNYFCPEDNCADRIKDELKKAETSIHFMTFSFTHDGIANVILIKNQEGIDVKGVMEARQVSKYSKFDVLQYQTEDVFKDANKQSMHHKVFIIDEKTVITGSMNPSKGGDERNDENVLIIEDREIAKKFVEEFERVYEEAT